MTYGLAGGFKVYQDQFQTGIVETLTQNSNAFNEASQGAIALSTISRRGDFSQEAFFQVLSGMVSRRDNTSNAAAVDQNLTQDEWISVKLNRKIGPVNQSRDSFRKIMMGKTEEEMSFILGQMAGKGMQLDMLNAAVLAARAALAAQSAVAVSESTTLKTTGLVDGLAAFGDAASNIACWVMHSKQYYDLVKDQITSNIYGVSNFAVANASPVTLNRPVIVTDSASLITSAANTLAAPTLSSLTTSTAGGSLAGGTYLYKVTWLNANGETVGSNEMSVTTSGTTSSNSLGFSAAPAGATGGRVYRGTAAGAENAYYAIANNVTAFVDTGAASTAGTPPATNTATTGVMTSTYYCLGLTAGGVVVENTEEEELIVQDVTGNENLAVRMQGEFAYNVGIKGFKWDITQGANPTNAAMGTGANWKANRASFKDFAGVVVETL